MPKLVVAESYKDTDCPIAGLYSTRGRTPAALLVAVDNSNNIPENTSAYHTDSRETLEDAAPDIFFPSGILVNGMPSGHIVVTDKAISGVLDTTTTPLYFSYELKYDVANRDPRRVINLKEFNGDTVNPNSYTVETADFLLYPSGATGRYDPNLTWTDEEPDTDILDTSTDPDHITLLPSGIAQRARLLLPASVVEPGRSLEVSYQAYLFGNRQDQTEFVNPVPLYTEGYDWVNDHGYIKARGRLANKGNQDIFVKHRPDKRVRLAMPTGTKASVWRPTVTVGSFTKVDMPVDPTGAIVYEVANRTEGTLENRSRLLDYGDDAGVGALVNTLKIRQEPVELVDSRTIKVTHPHLMIDVSGMVLGEEPDGIRNDGYPWYIPLEMADRGESTIRSDQGTPSGVKIYNGTIPYPQHEIIDWDSRNGYIRLNQNVTIASDAIRASYMYHPTTVEVRSVDMNPRLEENAWASGSIRVVLTDQNLAWHYVQDYPSGVYDDDSVGYNVYENTRDGLAARDVALLSGVIVGDYALDGFSPSDINVIDIRRPGGGIRDEVTIDRQEDAMWLDNESTLL
jgi:hypothetical protein